MMAWLLFRFVVRMGVKRVGFGGGYVWVVREVWGSLEGVGWG